MPFWMKRVFIQILPKMLMIERPKNPVLRRPSKQNAINKMNKSLFQPRNQMDSSYSMFKTAFVEKMNMMESSSANMMASDLERAQIKLDSITSKFKDKFQQKIYPPSIRSALKGIQYINLQMKKENIEREEIDDWKYASMVIDRLLLWIFTSACLMVIQF
jgi:nicotinic acetylcholine receptor, invertebrate